MAFIIGIVIYSLIFFVVLFLIFYLHMELNKEAERLKAQLAAVEKGSPASVDGDSAKVKEELASMKVKFADKVREKEALSLELSRIKSQLVDDEIRSAELSVKDKEIRRLTSELQHVAGSGSDTVRFKEELDSKASGPSSQDQQT